MDLHDIQSILRPTTREALPPLTAGDACLAGGTWLFSEPQPHLRRLIDLTALDWPPITIDQTHLRIAATCTLATLETHPWPTAWASAPLIAGCCQALLGSFKIATAATVGGNLCLALPASPMAALAVALDGICTIWSHTGTRHLPARDLITGDRRNALAEGEILRDIAVPLAALAHRSAFRQISLTPLGRSAALLIGNSDGAAFQLTITAATPRPVQLRFAEIPTAQSLADRIDADIPSWHDDVHGAPDWRRHITHLAAQQIRAELAP